MKIGFAKSFKVSGTTVADILLKISYFYGEYFDLKTKSIAFATLKPSIPVNVSKFNVFIEDERWNLTNVKKILGKDSLYITIMRNPVDQFESMFHFMDMREFYNVSSFKEFIQNLKKDKIRSDRFKELFGRNQISYTLGLDEESFDNETAINAFINKVDDSFDFVMITEYFDESIILLNNLLGTHIGQMLYVPKLERQKDMKYKLSTNQKILLERWLKADVMLYSAFRRKLEQRVVGRVIQQTKIFRGLNNQLHRFCKVSVRPELEPKDPKKRFGIFKIELKRSFRARMLAHLCSTCKKSPGLQDLSHMTRKLPNLLHSPCKAMMRPLRPSACKLLILMLHSKRVVTVYFEDLFADFLGIKVEQTPTVDTNSPSVNFKTL
ncbi:galactose-3-O-sulfotransferase 3-like isoform X1 [Artemia franciscana]|uniref:galactose-3-O-sulfotransferase 3-like isoform X1 n=1 Tax=Artemia franciscana TaxID=6661 RepID=UPI0032DB6D71